LGKPKLIEFEFRFGFGFFPILKYGFGEDNWDIDTHPEHIPVPAPLILKLYFIS
jgi:hypothetical protein